MWHNETVNVWTHFMGKIAAFILIFVVLICCPSYGHHGHELYDQMKNLSSQDQLNYLNKELNSIEDELDGLQQINQIEVQKLMNKVEGVSYMVVKNAKEDIFNSLSPQVVQLIQNLQTV